MEKNPQNHYRRVIASGLAATALAGCSSAQNEVSPWIGAYAPEQIFHIPEACDIPLEGFRDRIEPGDHNDEIHIEHPLSSEDLKQHYRNSNSPLENRSNALEKVQNGMDFFTFFSQERFKVIEEVELGDTGIEVEVMSDDDTISINPEALSEIMLKPLLEADEFVQPHLQQQMRCYREAVIERRDFAGHKVSLHIPSDYTLCFTQDFAISDIHTCRELVDSGVHDRFTRGLAPPPISIETPFLTLSQKGNQLIYVLGSHEDPDRAGARADRVIMHEAGHFWWWLNDGPMRMSAAMEQPIHAMEDAIHARLEAQDKTLPRAVYFDN